MRIRLIVHLKHGYFASEMEKEIGRGGDPPNLLNDRVYCDLLFGISEIGRGGGLFRVFCARHLNQEPSPFSGERDPWIEGLFP